MSPHIRLSILHHFLFCVLAAGASSNCLAQPQVNGTNVRYITFDNGNGVQGEFRQTGDNVWMENGPRGRIEYREDSRDAWSVYLTGRETGHKIQIDLYLKQVKAGGTAQVLFRILSSSQQAPARPLGTQIQNNGTAPGTTGTQPAVTTYWIPVTQTTPDRVISNYNIRVPDHFVPWILRSSAMGWGGPRSEMVNGRQQTFITQKFTWHLAGSSPARTGQIRIDSASGGHDVWEHSSTLQQDQQFIRVLYGMGKDEFGDKDWQTVTLKVLQSPGNQPPNLVVTTMSTGYEIAIRKMQRLAETTAAGKFYPAIQVPQDLAGFQRAMLDYGNMGRRDPEFRRNNGSKTAIDLSRPTVVTDSGQETVFKDYPQAPYFEPLSLNAALTNAAQFQAEYQALTQTVSHYGPDNFNGAMMRGFGDRVQHFGYRFETEGEGAAAGPPGSHPHGWMASDSHFRPWFNVGKHVREVGLGAAKDANGVWYYCVVSGVGQ